MISPSKAQEQTVHVGGDQPPHGKELHVPPKNQMTSGGQKLTLTTRAIVAGEQGRVKPTVLSGNAAPCCVLPALFYQKPTLAFCFRPEAVRVRLCAA